MTYKTSDFFYNLPLELIAQKPVRPRDHSRLLVLDKKTGFFQHQHFYDIVDYLNQGDLLVLNNSKVFPARLIGRKEATGGQIEIFLHKKEAADIWECLIGGRVKVGLIIILSSRLKAEIIKNNGDGTWLVQFNLSDNKFFTEINKVGQVPLPPYIKRSRQLASDKNNYQTVFADNHQVGSAAAPTAGLHFTKSLLQKIKAKGVQIKYVTLHVGLGTFAPVKTEKISDHKMHSEFALVSSSTINSILETKRRGGRVIAVGTTSCRTLESLNWDKIKKTTSKEQSFWTDIFIYPGFKFRAVDALITNFHLPSSTLMMLVSALGGKKNLERAYQEAVVKKYRFFSYGDAMFIN
ncbi:MAG: tRNA preQ1(34) S-adenosylmethionine ribosyltransferase-isomerase QueA [Candidatus Falkowbacteria bacterium]|nr:MAG: tRNA preQ1(34) S-adenosylmethionine ribosyltransferase-isomerase QueA [Candidatus Falkowbacteria bacterium]